MRCESVGDSGVDRDSDGEAEEEEEGEEGEEEREEGEEGEGGEGGAASVTSDRAGAPASAEEARRAQGLTAVPERYRGYEDLVDATPDPSFFAEPTGLRANVRALSCALRHTTLIHEPSRNPSVRIYQRRQPKAAPAAPPPAGARRVELLDQALEAMKQRSHVTETPLTTVLSDRGAHRQDALVARALLRELHARYRRVQGQEGAE
ncbi:X-ray radiation resistance-associated protein 1-like [Petromyzon marinus]|uniref:X-ray radiation resistance-associated protein 1-like n=1 Tax=Petromyzon marinus TaxID=7757 RepID=UPI003F725199